MRRGRVIEFDEAVGLGAIVDDESGTPYRFHLIEIADRTRTIDVGQGVLFTEIARLGEIQAGTIHKV